MLTDEEIEVVSDTSASDARLIAAPRNAAPDLIAAAKRLREGAVVPQPCGKCGRDTVAGDCYGCEADRLTAELAAREKAEAERDRAVADNAALRLGLDECLAALGAYRHGGGLWDERDADRVISWLRKVLAQPHPGDGLLAVKVGRCETCRHWCRPSEWSKGWGACDLATSSNGEPLHPQSLTVAYDAEGYEAALRTRSRSDDDLRAEIERLRAEAQAAYDQGLIHLFGVLCDQITALNWRLKRREEAHR